jgi:hypothetical protein
VIERENLQLAAYLLVCSGVGAISGPALLGTYPPEAGWLATLGVVLFLGGITLFCAVSE